MSRRLFGAALVWLAATAAAAAQQTPARPGGGGAPPLSTDQCVSCHEQLAPEHGGAAASAFRSDVHRARGFSCVDCHGGDPSATSAKESKDPARGYRGIPTGVKVVESCARCHSDAETMRRFAPRQRVDQATEYATSTHGKRLAEGDSRVATCISCHNAHGIRQVSDAKSPVFPTNVAATCAQCHADPKRMRRGPSPERDPAEGTVPEATKTNQHAEYQKSAHYLAMTRRNDLSAPTCNDCHGNHGAAPPGVGAVANVCGTCHAVFAERFEASVHREIFERGCVECHGNHAVAPGTDEMLGTSKQAICLTCHNEGENGFRVAAALRAGIERLKLELSRVGDVTERVHSAGMESAVQELALAEARSQLTVARTEIHSVDLAALETVLAEAHKNLATVTKANDGALAELRFRRRGLMASLGAILIFVAALVLKIREVDRRRGKGGGDRGKG